MNAKSKVQAEKSKRKMQQAMHDQFGRSADAAEEHFFHTHNVPTEPIGGNIFEMPIKDVTPRQPAVKKSAAPKKSKIKAKSKPASVKAKAKSVPRRAKSVAARKRRSPTRH